MKKTLFILFLLFSFSQLIAQITCTVRGKVIGRPESKILLLGKSYEDIDQVGKRIEIQDSSFQFTITGTAPEIYELVFEEERKRGSWRSVSFCTFNGTVEMEVNTEKEYRKNKIAGGVENQALQDYNEMLENLYTTRYAPIRNRLDTVPRDKWMNELGRDLELQLDTTKGTAKNDLWGIWYAKQRTREIYTPFVKQVLIAADSASKTIQEDMEKYEREHPSLWGYSKLVDKLIAFKSFEEDYMGEQDALGFLEGQYKYYAKAYPKHTYTQMCKELIKNLRKIHVGGKYIDFSAPDLEGRMVTLSEQIKGKIALIDLWASWCGPCRAEAISFIPIYEEYKDRGFTIVGVAREKNNDQAMRNAIKKDGYTWTNLIELNDRANIWNSYGIGNTAGGVYLVDTSGKILAIDPNAAEIREILKSKIK